MIALILLLWENATPSVVVIDWEMIWIFQVNKKEKDNYYDKLNTNGNQTKEGINYWKCFNYSKANIDVLLVPDPSAFPYLFSSSVHVSHLTELISLISSPYFLFFLPVISYSFQK